MLIKVDIPGCALAQGVTPDDVVQAVRRSVEGLAGGPLRVDPIGPVGASVNVTTGAGRVLDLVREECSTYEVTYRVVVPPETVRVPRSAGQCEADQHFLAAAERLINAGRARVVAEKFTGHTSMVIDFSYQPEAAAVALEAA